MSRPRCLEEQRTVELLGSQRRVKTKWAGLRQKPQFPEPTACSESLLTQKAQCSQGALCHLATITGRHNWGRGAGRPFSWAAGTLCLGLRPPRQPSGAPW